MAKTYRTAKGRNVDIGALLNQNEDVRAVGNMNVNARGDLIDSQNKTIERKNKQVQKQYRKQIRNTVTDDVVYSSKRAAQAAQDEAQANPGTGTCGGSCGGSCGGCGGSGSTCGV